MVVQSIVTVGGFSWGLCYYIRWIFGFLWCWWRHENSKIIGFKKEKFLLSISIWLEVPLCVYPIKFHSSFLLEIQ